MEAQGPNQKPEPSPGPETELPGPLNTLVDQNTPLTKDEEEFHFDTSSVQEISDFSEFWGCTEEETNDRAHQASAQSYFTLSDRNVEEVLKAQEANYTAFLEEFRNISSQHISRVEQVTRTEQETGMERIVNYVKSFIPQPAQASNASTIVDLRAQLQAEQDYVQKLTIDHNNMAQHSHKQKQDLGKVNAKLDDALHERDQLRQLLDGGSLANSGKITDDSIRAKWKELTYNIRCLAHFLAQDPLHQQLDELATERLRFVLKDYRRYINDEEYRELLIMGYLWVIVQDEVFDAEEQLWGGPGLKPYKITRDHIITLIGDRENILNTETSIAHAARWLAQGSDMIGNLWGRDDRGMRRLVLRETKRLRPFYSARLSSTDRCEKQVTDQLRDIICTAIDLDKMMMRSKAIFQVHWRDQSQKPYGCHQKWNGDAMNSEASKNALSPKSRVLFFISPILRKVGTADGQRYNSNMVLAKGLVVCD
ncbi:hypothetical protein FPRO06_00840 [Fusarium proliferatum]|uniref:Uncharacterized protein n=1 Tax=Fusarium proliferatum (strain ET1) TaxID=1227346 RepID=A0A1L7V5V8_FUSPR|nr:uncharacterized protein FPRO_01214 [Fusarium proliferatum ET1]KAG4265560.1 hypothetical protein FPRO03_00844 [Fusarium proliferatum]KAI1057918.1 hypothetical protein LB506_000608 [Fusarium annulatum]KAG4286614.1 hypothetical protein FPRO04_00157 [Fusarium proliferatum]KAG4294255.1 hypothetical protein FPRO06_00840 [Fusarium proliferatum]CVK95017.1 uncharacterized protein FPRN_01161 [Fusarium proliferatum]